MQKLPRRVYIISLPFVSLSICIIELEERDREPFNIQINVTQHRRYGNGVANKRNEIVPYEHLLGARSHDPSNFGGDLSSREENKEDTSGTRKLASAIVTPSRKDYLRCTVLLLVQSHMQSKRKGPAPQSKHPFT
ncbi:hypothetical protein YC2023_032616 [Brassica napus]